MAARRTPRQIAFDSWAEVRDFQPEVIGLIEMMGGKVMHPNPAQVRAGRMITPTSCPWPDLSIWFPEGTPGLHLVELKSHIHPKPREGQPEVFASLDAAEVPVLVWEPRDLDLAIPVWLRCWAAKPLPPRRYPEGLDRAAGRYTYVPRSRKLAAQLKEAAQ